MYLQRRNIFIIKSIFRKLYCNNFFLNERITLSERNVSKWVIYVLEFEIRKAIRIPGEIMIIRFRNTRKLNIFSLSLKKNSYVIFTFLYSVLTFCFTLNKHRVRNVFKIHIFKLAFLLGACREKFSRKLNVPIWLPSVHNTYFEIAIKIIISTYTTGYFST